MIEVRRATEADAHALAPHLRAADVRELAASGNEPLAALLRGVELSGDECFVALLDGERVAMFGLAPLDAGRASPWMLGTDTLSGLRVSMLRTARTHVARWCQRFDLWNLVHAEHHESIRWLDAIGFKLHAPVLYPKTGERFVPFSMAREEAPHV